MKTTLWACAAMLPILMALGFISEAAAVVVLRAVRPDIDVPPPDGGFYFILLAVWAVVSGVMIWLTHSGYLGRD